MKKLLLLLVGAIVAFAAHADVTIKVKNDASWSQVNIWAWANGVGGGPWLAANGHKNGSNDYAWPGPKMTYNSTTEYYEITFTNTPDEFIISNNGGSQASFKNLSNVDNTIYTTNGATQQAPADYVVYFYDSTDATADHSDMLIHVWNTSGDYKKWSDNDKLTSTGKYFKIGSTYYPVWKYAFTWNQTPTELKFHDSQEYNNSSFKNGGVYKKTSGGIADDSTLTGSDLCDKQNDPVVDPDPQPVVVDGKRVKHTVYVYNKSGKNIMDLTAYVWNGDDKVSPWPGIPVSYQGKYINKDGQQYPAWEFSFYWDKSVDGAQIIFQGTGLKQSNNTDYTEGKFYYYDGTESGDNSVIKTDDPNRYELVDRTPVAGMTTIYMHFKRDYVALGDVNVPPHCHIYNANSGAEYTKGAWEKADVHTEDMYLVNGKYQIWGYDIPTSEVSKYNNVIFSFKHDGSDSWRHYRTDEVANMYGNQGEQGHDGDRWADFIYATGNVGNQYGAVQTYMSYARFKFRDQENNPRKWAFILGSPYMTFTPREGENLTPVALGWDVLNPQIANAEDGCFYMKLTPTFPDTADKENSTYGNRELAKFKVGWINVGWAKEWATSSEGPGIDDNKDYNQRGWATFDLGIIGVNDRDSRIIDKDNPKINIQAEGQNALFRTNTSVTYSNFSQYDWCLVNGIAEAGKTYYAVIDTHEECRSVTLCTFEPHPELNVLPTSIQTLALTKEHAKGLHDYMHNNGLHLEAAATNGHIMMDKVNVANGYLQVKGAEDATVYDAGFTPTYNIKLDGNDLLYHVGKPAYLQMNYLPLDEGKAFQVRATYEDNDTHITFHSLKSEGTLDAEIQPKAPVGKINKASFFLDNTGNFGVWMPDVQMHVVDNTYAVYGDFQFDGFNGEIVNKDHHITGISAFTDNSYLLDWTKLEDESQYDFNGYAHDWSSKIIKDSQTLPVYLPEVVTDVNSFEELNQKYRNYPVHGYVYAVYPFLYELNPTVTVLEKLPSNSPRREASVVPNSIEDDGIENLAAFALNKMVLAHEIDGVVNGVISGIEGVEADTAVDAEAEYYTISGVRVMGQPAPGLYIRRQGDKVSKVVIR